MQRFDGHRLLPGTRPGGRPRAGPTPDLVAATRATAFGSRALGPSRCHGLAGAINHLLDAAAGDDPDALVPAHELGALLRAFVPIDALREDSGDRTGELASPLVARTVLSSGYLEGLAGILAVALRLADPTVPDLIGGPWWVDSCR